MSSSGTTTSTSNTAPWSAQQPYLQSLFSNAQNAYNQYGSNPSSYVAGFNPQQTQAFGMTQNAADQTNAAGNISGLNNTAAGFTNGLLGGSQLNANPGNSAFGQFASGSQVGANPGNSAFSQFASGNQQNNPYEQQQIQAAIDPITRAYQTATAPGIASQMESAGRYGSGAMANADNQAQQNLVGQLGNAVAPIVSNMYQTNQANQLAGASGLSSNYNAGAQQQLTGAAGLSGNFNTAAGNQLSAALNSPNLANSNWQTIGNLQSTGAQQQALQQQQNQSPFTLANNYGSLIGGNYGGTSSSSTPYFTNNVAGALGGLSTIAGMSGTPLGQAAGSAIGNGASSLYNWLTGA